MINKPSVYITYIGVSHVNLRGRGATRYAGLQNAEVDQRKITRLGKIEVIETVILNFHNEEEMNHFLQEAVNAGYPFEDNPKTNAYREARRRHDSGDIKGQIKALV